MSDKDVTDDFNMSFSDLDYHKIAEFVHKTAGINLLEGKKELIRTRLGKRMRLLQINDFRTYFKHVMSDETGEEIVFLLDALATNLTSFFREDQHFDFMGKTLLPLLEAKRREKGSHRLRIWSAACSSGEEPYTIAMVVMEKSPYFGTGGDCKILATDISTKVLNIAKQGMYGPERVKTVPPMLVSKYFQKTGDREHHMYQIIPQLRNLIAFRRLNLMDPLPFKNPLDLIFCRNVMIYFDKETIGQLVSKYYQILAPGGYLFIGHSESLSGFAHDFKYVQPCIYQKAE
jgi:chemotaxis protein methyltransferase CheR